MLKIIAIAWSLLCIFVLSACNNDETVDDHHSSLSLPPESNKTQIDKPKSTYMKPGAAIRFNHNYDGKTEVGEVETIQLSFTESYSSGQMRITLQADAALNLEPSNQNYVFSMDSDRAHQLEVAVSAASEGKHYLNIFATATDGSGQSKSRVFAIAFYIGNLSSTRQAKPVGNNPSSENMIYLPSQETVIK